jgi:hypothetical protein
VNPREEDDDQSRAQLDGADRTLDEGEAHAFELEPQPTRSLRNLVGRTLVLTAHDPDPFRPAYEIRDQGELVALMLRRWAEGVPEAIVRVREGTWLFRRVGARWLVLAIDVRTGSQVARHQASMLLPRGQLQADYDSYWLRGSGMPGLRSRWRWRLTTTERVQVARFEATPPRPTPVVTLELAEGARLLASAPLACLMAAYVALLHAELPGTAGLGAEGVTFA